MLTSLLPYSFVLFLNWLRTQAGESGIIYWVPQSPVGGQCWKQKMRPD